MIYITNSAKILCGFLGIREEEVYVIRGLLVWSVMMVYLAGNHPCQPSDNYLKATKVVQAASTKPLMKTSDRRTTSKLPSFYHRNQRAFLSRAQLYSRGCKVSRTLTLVATAYAANDGMCGDKTACGTGVYRGIVAVDPKLIKIGSYLYIEGYGLCRALDVGGTGIRSGYVRVRVRGKLVRRYVKRRRIDLGHNSKLEADRFGRRKVRVMVLVPPV